MGIGIKRFAGVATLLLLVAMMSGCASSKEFMEEGTAYRVPGSTQEKLDTAKYFYETTGLPPGGGQTVGEYDPNEKPHYTPVAGSSSSSSDSTKTGAAKE